GVGAHVRVRLGAARPQAEAAILTISPVPPQLARPGRDGLVARAAEDGEVEGVEERVGEEERARGGGALFEAAVRVGEQEVGGAVEAGEGGAAEADAEAAEPVDAIRREAQRLLRRPVRRGERRGRLLRRREGDGERPREGVLLVAERGAELEPGVADLLHVPRE